MLTPALPAPASPQPSQATSRSPLSGPRQRGQTRGPEDRVRQWEGAWSAPLALWLTVLCRALSGDRTLGLHPPPSPQLPWLHLGGWQLSISGLTSPRRTGHQTLELDTGSTSLAPPSSNEMGRDLGGSQVPNETLSTVRLEMGAAQG